MKLFIFDKFDKQGWKRLGRIFKDYIVLIKASDLIEIGNAVTIGSLFFGKSILENILEGKKINGNLSITFLFNNNVENML